jgi:exoribonuclease R
VELAGRHDAAGATSTAGLQPHLQTLYALFKVLGEARGKRGAIDFETIETMMLFNEQGKIENIVPVYRNDAHRLIEECMLAANVCASDFLQARRQPCLYRIHEGPTAEKLEALRNFLKEFGLGLGGGDDPTARDYAVAGQHQDPSRCPVAADGDASLPAPGHVQPGQCRPFRFVVRTLHPLHVADPSLP